MSGLSVTDTPYSKDISVFVMIMNWNLAIIQLTFKVNNYYLAGCTTFLHLPAPI